MINNMTIYYLYQYINKGCDKKIIVRKIIRYHGTKINSRWWNLALIFHLLHCRLLAKLCYLI